MAEIGPGRATRAPSRPNPFCIAEVEQLVKKLYLPGPPAQIARIQESLQALQRSEDGWKLADALLASSDNKVRFFGALTFTVKLNLDWQTLDDEAAQALLHMLLSWLVRLVSQNEEALVVRKLCSTLVSYFLRFSSLWERCIRHVLCSFHEGYAVALNSLDGITSSRDLITGLKGSQMTAALWFSSALAEDIRKVDNKSLKHQKYHEQLSGNVEDAVMLMQHTFSEHEPVQNHQVQLRKEGLSCFQSWVFYAQLAYGTSSDQVSALRTLLQPSVRFLAHDETYEPAIELLTEILSHYEDFLDGQALHTLSSILSSPWSQTRYEHLHDGDFDRDSLDYGRFLLAFGEVALQDLFKASEHQDSQRLLHMLHGLLTCEGHPIAEDEICSQAVEFWTTVVEYMTDVAFERTSDEAPWFAFARTHILQAVEECWAKIRWPSPEVTSSWESDIKRGFQDFRKDVGDLLQSSYPLLGVDIAQKLVDLTLNSIQRASWEDAEAALFCLNMLGDAIAEGETEDAILARLFGSSLFASSPAGHGSLPTKARQTSVYIVGHYASFFERHTEYLAAALDFLFRSLATSAVAASASRSIFSLCSSCRKSLAPELGAFLHQYEQISGAGPADSLVKERILGAMASIIQAVSPEAEKGLRLQRLLAFVEHDVARCLDVMKSGDEAKALELGVGSLQCLVGIGKSLQEPDDVPIDLDSDAPRSTFWDDGPGGEIQSHIVRMVQAVSEALHKEGEVIEAACSVFKTGFTESSPGPFVFASSVTTRFLLQCNIQTPRLGVVLGTACALISSRSTDASPRIDDEAQALLTFVVGLIHQLGDATSDPEIAQNAIDFICRLVPRYTPILLSLQPRSALEATLIFTLTCLKGSDQLPKRSAASFWASFVAISDQPDPVQAAVNEIMQQSGPLLAEILMSGLGGQAARSDVDILTEPLKKLVFKQPRSKMWLEAALNRESFPSKTVNASEKRVFLQKVMSLRGARGTNQIAKDFWLACRGTNFTYAS